MCKCISRWHYAMAPDLTSPHLRGPGQQHQGPVQENTQQILMRETELQMCVRVCTDVCFIVCVLISLFVDLISACSCWCFIGTAYLGQEHITQIWAAFSIDCIIEFHVAAVNRKHPSVSLMLVCEYVRDKFNSLWHLVMWDKVSDSCWKFRSHCWSLICMPRIVH